MRRLSAPENAFLKMAASVASPGGRGGSLLVIIYHRVLAAPDALLVEEPDIARFTAEVDLLSHLCTVLRFSDAVERLQAGTLPPRAVAITFDDGYANNSEFAAPILAARGLPATFFVATGFVAGGIMWNDKVIEAVRQAPAEFDLGAIGFGRFELSDIASRRRAIDELLHRLKYLEFGVRIATVDAIAERAGLSDKLRPMMDERQVRGLAALGMEIGAHSVRHPILARINGDDARREISESKRRLEEIVGAPVRAFAYPNGRPGVDYGTEHVQMVRDAGFTAAASTAWGAATTGSDPLQVPRVAPWDRSPARYALRLVRAFTERRPQTV